MGIGKLKKLVLAGNVNMEGRSWAKISEEGKQLVRSLLNTIFSAACDCSKIGFLFFIC